MKLPIIIASLLLFTVTCFAQPTGKEPFKQLQKQLATEKDLAKKADLLYQTAHYFLDKEDISKKQLDSAALLNSELKNISRKLDLKKHIALSMMLDGQIAVKKENYKLAATLHGNALDYAHKHGLKIEEATIYRDAVYYMDDDQMPKKIEYLKKAISLYKKAAAVNDEAETLTEITELYFNVSEYDSCAKYARQAIKLKKSIKRPDIYKEYVILAQNYWVHGNQKNALAYALEAEKIAENVDAEAYWVSLTYNLLGVIYGHLKYDDKSIAYYKRAIALAKKSNDNYSAERIALNAAHSLSNKHKFIESIDLLNGLGYYPGKDCSINCPSIYVLAYCGLKQYDKAKPYYEQLLKCDEGNYTSDSNPETMYFAIIRYLINTGQASKAYTYINKLKKLPAINNNLLDLRELEYNHFRADSATGNYLAALKHYRLSKSLNDSIINLKSRQQFNALQVKYETDKKDKNIRLLTEQGKLQEEKIRNATILRYVFIGSLALLALFVGLLYNRSRLKQRANKKLELKQQQINEQNDQLKKLLTEKEWLLKEIHHRVKNNLQIVISLLNTQSAYLENKDALMAIQNSQHRMHAMSLIHQKLYQSSNLAAIDMAWYIYELVNYLKECFSADKKIGFKLDTDHVELDVTQAVPLGLILNEAISNAIKYAFTAKNSGQITISLKNIEHDTYKLIIADDGVGLPEGFETQERESLGINLMIGLTDQLDGTLTFINNNGLTINILFTRKRQLTEADVSALN